MFDCYKPCWISVGAMLDVTHYVGGQLVKLLVLKIPGSEMNKH